MAVTIRHADSQQDLDAVRRLMRGFVAWHYERHAEYRDLIDRYFDPGKFDAELAGLPGDFAPPDGRLLVAEKDGEIGGTVALRPLGEGRCEMKRMFVDPRFQGTGAGRALARAVIDEAKAAGYSTMLLDTGPKQVEAQGLYASLGFKHIEPYYALDEEMAAWLVFMRADLG